MRTKRSKRILAIDPGTHYMGVAILDGERLAYYGVKTLPRRNSPHELLSEGIRVIKGLVDDFRPDTMVVEKTFFANNRNSALLNVFANEIGAIGRRRHLNVTLIAANSVRKKVCNNGAATKREVAQEMARRYPELFPYLSSDRRWKERFHHNMFDAVALGLAVQGGTIRSRERRLPRRSVRNSPNN